MIECDDPNDLPTVSFISTWEIQAIKILIGNGRRIFFITRHVSQYDINGYETGNPCVISVRIAASRLKRMLAFAVNRHRNAVISRTRPTETADIIRLTHRCSAVHGDTCPLIVDGAGT